MRAIEHVGHEANVAEEIAGFAVADLIAGGTVDVVEGSLGCAALGNLAQIPHISGLCQACCPAVEVGCFEPHEVLELGHVGQLAL